MWGFVFCEDICDHKFDLSPQSGKVKKTIFKKKNVQIPGLVLLLFCFLKINKLMQK